MPSNRRTSFAGNQLHSHTKTRRNTIKPVMISSDGFLQKQQHVCGLKYDATVAPNSIVSIILHELYNSKGHQGIIHTFETIRRFYWWLKLHQDIVKHINRYNIFAKNLPNMAKYSQQPLKYPNFWWQY